MPGSRVFRVETGGGMRPYEVEITEHTVAITGLRADSLTLVHLSDLHAGFGNTTPVFEETLTRVNALAPDLIVITGDFIDDHKRRDYPLTELLHRFKARYGIFASYGNHDHRTGIDSVKRQLQQAGACILNNSSIEVEAGLWLAGVDDYYEGEPDAALALRDVPDGVTPIVLSHNPTLIDKLKGRELLQLSGHTHGGQINLPFPTPAMVVRFHLRCRYVAGWYRQGRSRMYVNRGLGVTGKPFRYRCPGEIAVMQLIPAER